MSAKKFEIQFSQNDIGSDVLEGHVLQRSAKFNFGVLSFLLDLKWSNIGVKWLQNWLENGAFGLRKDVLFHDN